MDVVIVETIIILCLDDVDEEEMPPILPATGVLKGENIVSFFVLSKGII